MGCEGRVEEAQGVLKLCDQLKEERAQLQEVLFGLHLFIASVLTVFMKLCGDVNHQPM